MKYLKDITVSAGGVQAASNPTDAEIAQLEQLLEQEALLFVEQNGAQVFKLGKDYINAILFNHAIEYIGIPDLSANPTMQEVANREQILKARNMTFQLVAKAELELNEEYNTVSANVENFLLEVLKAAGQQAGVYLLKILAGMALTAIGVAIL